MKYAFYTLGCKVNQYETQAMEQLLLARGHDLGAFDEVCDAYIINTCTVTATGDRKSRSMVRRARRLNPDAAVGICGCYAQVSPGEAAALEADVVSGTGDRLGFLEALERAAAARMAGLTPAQAVRVDPARKRGGFEVLPAGGLAARTRAMLKVEDGCDNFCTYCIIPFARGPVRSLPLGTAVEQAKTLAAEGYREIVVTGIEISSWGGDLPGKPVLADLLAVLCAAVPGVRIRLGSLEPRTVTEAFCRRLCGFENLCPQFHLSLQSGCDTVLRRMNRRYETARCGPAAPVFPRLRRDHGPHRGLPRRDGGGVRGLPPLPRGHGPRGGPRLPLLPPRRDPGRVHAGPDLERREGAPRPPGGRDGPGLRRAVPPRAHRHGPARALRAGRGRVQHGPRPLRRPGLPAGAGSAQRGPAREDHRPPARRRDRRSAA